MQLRVFTKVVLECVLLRVDTRDLSGAGSILKDEEGPSLSPWDGRHPAGAILEAVVLRRHRLYAKI